MTTEQNDSGACVPRSNTFRQAKEMYSERINRSNLPLARIDSIQFGLMNPDVMCRMAADVITRPTLNSKGAPLLHSINSPLLGPTDRSSTAKCCGLRQCDCDQRFGVYKLAYPVYDILFLDRIIKILNCLCPWCARVLLDKEHPKYASIAEEKNAKNRLYLLSDACVNIAYCSTSKKRRKLPKKTEPVTVELVSPEKEKEVEKKEKPVQTTKGKQTKSKSRSKRQTVQNRKGKKKNNSKKDSSSEEDSDSDESDAEDSDKETEEEEQARKQLILKEALEKQRLLDEEKAEKERIEEEQRLIASGCCGGVQFHYIRRRCEIWRVAKDTTEDGQFERDKKYQLSQAMVLDILRRISEEDITLVGSHPIYARPEHMIVTVMPVPPANNRPVMGYNNGTKRQRTENAYTRKLDDQVAVNVALRKKRCELIHAMRREQQKKLQQDQNVNTSVIMDESTASVLNASSKSIGGMTDLLGTSISDLGGDMSLVVDRSEQQQEQEDKMQMLINSDDGGSKTKSTLTAVLRAEKAQKKALVQKKESRLQLEVQNGRLKMGQAYASGDPSIDDIEWNDFLKFDAAFFDDTYDLIAELQSAIGSYVKEDTPAPKRTGNKKPFLRPGNNKQSLNSRVKGKAGLVRANLDAKCTGFSCRGVIIPDADIDMDELGVPVSAAEYITLPEQVTQCNIESLRRLVRNGPQQYPGANYISISKHDVQLEKDDDPHALDADPSQMIDLRYEDRIALSENLRLGMIVHRHVVVGDYLPFNRPPSLHKFSFMSHRVRVVQGSCFRMNPAACKCYACDFDGDAMVLHILQTLGARIESRRLLYISLSFITPQSSTPLITPIQDTVTGGFQISGDDIIFTDKDYYKELGAARYLAISRIGVTSPFMLVKRKGDRRWHAYRSGKQLFSELLPANLDFVKSSRYFARHPSRVIGVRKNRTLDQEISEWYDQPAHQQEVVILRQRMVRGVISSKVIGSSPTGLIHQILHEYGNETCRRFESDLQCIIHSVLANLGFSMGPSDCVLPNDRTIRRLIHDGLEALSNHPLLQINPSTCVDSQSTTTSCTIEEVVDTETVAPKSNKRRRRHIEAAAEERDREERMLEDSVFSRTTDSQTAAEDALMASQETFDVIDERRAQELRLEVLRERTIQDLLNQFTNFIGTQLLTQVEGWNRLWQMTVSGAKGKLFNLTQILGLLGQTEMEGERLRFDRRVTSHFVLSGTDTSQWHELVLKSLPGDSLLSNGFISNSFSRGLSPIEFYSHAMGSRQGLIDSSTSTSDAGYTGRRLMHAMSSLMVQNDLSVKDPKGNVLQLLVGKDGFEAEWLCPIYLECIQMNNQHMDRAYSGVPLLEELWSLEVAAAAASTKIGKKEHAVLKQLLTEEIAALKCYRDKQRQIRLHHGCSKIDTQVIVPVNVPLVMRRALGHQRRVGKKHHGSVLPLTPSLVVRMTHACMERLYSYYPGVFNRLWDFETVFYTALCCKNVLLDMELNYIGLSFALAEVESRFQKAIAHAMTLVGPLAAQMVGELYTQNKLNQHRVAGSSDAAGGEEVDIDVFQNIINPTEKPKNPQMRIYTVTIEQCKQFMSQEEIERHIFRGASTDALSEEEQQHCLAKYVCDHLVHQTLDNLCLSSPSVVVESSTDLLGPSVHAGDRAWLGHHVALMDDEEKGMLSSLRSNRVLRFVIDDKKMNSMHLSCERVTECIQQFLKEDPSPTITSVLEEPDDEDDNEGEEASESEEEGDVDSNSSSSSVDASSSEEDEVDDTMSILKDIDLDRTRSRKNMKGGKNKNKPPYATDLIAVWSPVLSSQNRSYRVLRVYVSLKAKYYSKALKANNRNPDKLMSSLLTKITKNTHLGGMSDIRAASIEKEVIQVHNPLTGDLAPRSEYMILTAGSNVANVFAFPFVDAKRSSTSCLIETAHVWGIQAGSNRLYHALCGVLQSNGSSINKRHLQMVVKAMCHRGYYMPFRRHGMSRVPDYSILHLVSFEEVLKTIADACACGDRDLLQGPAENSMVGKLIPAGTGAAKLTLPPLDDPTTQPTPQVIASHIEMVRKQVLPVFTELDARIMLENSGEERLLRPTEEDEEGNLLSQTYRGYGETQSMQLIALRHRAESKQCRSTSLHPFVKRPREGEDENASTARKRSRNEVGASTALGVFWEEIEQKRRQARLAVKEQLAKKLSQSDHDTVRRKAPRGRKKAGAPSANNEDSHGKTEIAVVVEVENNKKRKRGQDTEGRTTPTVEWCIDTIGTEPSRKKSRWGALKSKQQSSSQRIDEIVEYRIG